MNNRSSISSAHLIPPFCVWFVQLRWFCSAGFLLLLVLGSEQDLSAQWHKEMGVELGVQQTNRMDPIFSSGTWTGVIPIVGLQASFLGEHWRYEGFFSTGFGNLAQSVGLASVASYQQWRGGIRATFGNALPGTQVNWQVGLGLTFQQIQMQYPDFGNQKDVDDQQVCGLIVGRLETALFGSRWKGRLGVEASPIAYLSRVPGTPFASNDVDSKSNGSVQMLGDWMSLQGELGLRREWTSGWGVGLVLRPSWMQYATPQVQQWQPAAALQFQYAW